MDLQSALCKFFECWQPTPALVVERTKCSVTLDWRQEALGFLAGDLLYRLERNEKIPPWVVAYSGGKTCKLIDYLAPRHPYRFRLRVILKATAVPSLAQKAIAHFGDEAAVHQMMKELKGAWDETSSEVKAKTDKQDDISQQEKDDGGVSVKKSSNPWLASRWSEATWTSTDTDGTSAACFCMAVRCGYYKQIQIMLEEKPALIGTVNSANGFTPLAIAVRKGDINTVKLLLSSGAELDQPSATGQTALHLALLTARAPIATLLLDTGADLKARDVNGLRGEHYAVDSGSVDMLQLVLERGGDVDARDNHGWTPLFRALCQGAKTELVEELVQRGSDVEVRDHAGLPLTSVARLLKNRHGRNRDSILRLVDSQFPHEKALANFTRLTKKVYNVHIILK